MDKDLDNKQYEFIFSNDDLINIDLSDIYKNHDTITISTMGSPNQVLINTGETWEFTDLPSQQVLFDNIMPNPIVVNEMCKEYPALEKAYENFKSIYKLVEQDWNGKRKESGDPPF